MNNMKKIEKLHRLASRIAVGYDVKESKESFKTELTQAKKDGLDLNDRVTLLNRQDGDEQLFDGDLVRNWDELYRSNWNGHYYVGDIRTDFIRSMTIYSLLTNENSDDVFNIIEEVYPNFKAEDKDSIILNLEDVLNKIGYLKIEMLDNRYMLSEEEKDKFTDWMRQFEDVGEHTILIGEYIVPTTDILTGDTVYFKIKANQYEAFDNWNSVDHLRKEIIK